MATANEIISFFFYSCYLFLGVTAFFANGFCLFAIVKGKILQKNGAFILIALLCVWDTLAAIGVFNSGVTRLLAMTSSYTVSQLQCYFIFLPIYLSSASSVTMLTISLERFYIVCSSTHYQRNGPVVVKWAIAVNVCVGAALIAWSATGVDPNLLLTNTCSSTIGPNPTYIQYASALTRSAPSIACCVFYIATVIMFRKQHSKVSANSANPALVSAKAKRQANLTKMALVVCATYVLCTGLTTLVIIYIAPYILPLNQMAYLIVVQMLSTLGCANYLINAFLFPWKNPEIRTSMENTLGYVFCCKQMPTGKNGDGSNSSHTNSKQQNDSKLTAAVEISQKINTVCARDQYSVTQSA